MEYKRTYSLAEIARKLKKAPTTVSTWRSQYKEFLPTIGHGKGRRYTEEALEIFALIAKMKSGQEPHERIVEVLREVASEIVVYDDEDDERVPILQEMAQGYANILQIIQDQQDIIQRQEEAMQAIQEKLDTMDTHMNSQDKRLEERDRKLMETLRLLQEDKQKSWWDRIRGR